MLSHPSALAGFRPPDCPRFVREDLPERSYNDRKGSLLTPRRFGILSSVSDRCDRWTRPPKPNAEAS